MRTITINLEDAKKASALMKFLEAFGIPFKDTQHKTRKTKSEESPYNPEFVAKIQQAQKDVAEGKGITMTLAELDTFLGLQE